MIYIVLQLSMMQEARSSSVLRLSGQHALMYATLNTSYEAAPSPPGNPVTKIVAGSSSTRDVGSSVARRCKHILCLRMGALWPHKTWSGITAQQSVTCSVLALGGSGTRPRGLCAASDSDGAPAPLTGRRRKVFVLRGASRVSPVRGPGVCRRSSLRTREWFSISA